MRHSTLMLCLCLATVLSACLTEEINLCDQADYPWECTCPDAQEKLREFGYYDVRCDVCKTTPDDPMCNDGPPDAGKDAGGRGDAGRDAGQHGDSGVDDGGQDPDGGRWQCPQECEAPKPNCDVDAQSCEACNEDSHCKVTDVTHCVDHSCVECRAGEPADCETSDVGRVCVAGSCEQCAGHPDCADVTKARCDTDHKCTPCDDDAQCNGRLDGEGDSLAQCVAGVCVECENHADCTDPGQARCDANHECVPCDDDMQCDNRIDGEGDPIEVCDAGACVECTGLKYAACLEGVTQYVCDSVKRTCSDKLAMSASTCQPCVSDAQCMTGRICMPTKFGVADTGLYCLWRQDAVSGSDCSNVRPFIGGETNWTSVDRVSTTVCKLTGTTCQGYGDFKNPCSGADSNGDAMCGAGGLADAYCASSPGGGFMCTTPCSGDSDCQNIVAHDDECQEEVVSAGPMNVCVFQ